MSKPITPYSISAPGFYGLNVQDSPVDMPQGFALMAHNCVIDKSGRIAARKGWAKVNSSNAELSTSDVTCIGELVQTTGTATLLAAGGGYLFKLSGTTLTTLTYGGGGVAPTISANNWTFCQLNEVAMFWQRGYDPLIYDPAVSTSTFRRLSERSGSTGTVYQCNAAISAYGRVWCADNGTDRSTLVWSDLLTPHIWSGGTSGSLDLRKVWPRGGDEIVTVAAHNNFLFIFGRKQILIYAGADDPATMVLSDTILGYGCIARDSVQNTGEDIIFLSDHGIMSMNRTIQEKSAPVGMISKNVLDEIQSHVTVETTENIKSCFSAVNDFYVITMPASNESYCFDMKVLLPDGSAKASTWSLVPKAFCETKSRKLYLGKAGYIGEYSDHLDDSATYRMSYYTTWIDFGNPIQTSILKKILLTLISGTNQSIIFKWAYDFSSTYFSEIVTISGLPELAEYGTAEYNIAEYSGSLLVNTISASGSSSGRVLQFGFEVDIDGRALSIQKIDLFTKDGRM